jgi:Zn-dependent peptidase ImmA (M78 family)
LALPVLISSPHVPLWKKLREAGETSANDLLNALGVRLPPVDVDYMARRLGIEVVRRSNLGYAGSVESEGNHAIIYLNRDDHPVRQRFSLAHEIGHLMLHPMHAGRMHFRDTNFYGDWRETQANRYAADLLMPEWMLDLSIGSTDAEVWRLARLFNVSEQAMQYRLENTGRW